jgi:ligand-binding sensor domain-containing protein/signal transduction histidine kinase
MRGRGWQAIMQAARCIAPSIACALLLATAAIAGEVPGIEQVRFRSYSTPDGLPQATIRAAAQDAAGFLWFGTQDGLGRFDGYGFKVYRHDRVDPWSLSDNHVTSIVADDDGTLWLATLAGGLDRYDPDLDRFKAWTANPQRDDAIASNNVTALVLDPRKRLWVASTGGRLQWMDREAGVLRDSGLGERAPLRMVRAMLPLRDGTMLLGTLDGLWRFDVEAGAMVEIRADPAVALDVYALTVGDDGSWWVGTADAGLYRFDVHGSLIGTYRHDTQANPLTTLHDDAVRALLFDDEGMLWIAGNAHGLARMNVITGQFVRYAHDPARPESIAANRLWMLMQERHGLLLVGSWNNGFSIHDPRTRAFSQIDSVSGDGRTLPARPVMSVHADADGTLWMGLSEGGGLVHLDPARGVLQRFTHDVNRPESLAHDFVRHVTRSRDGSLWVSTVGGGLDRLRPGATAFEHLRHNPGDPSSLASDSLLGFYEDSIGTQWIYTADRGVDERCAGCAEFRHHLHDPADPNSIGDNTVNAVLETRNGNLWMATRAGLMRYDRESGHFEHTLARADDPTSLSSNSTTVLSEDSHGDLWVGTQGGGLNRRVVNADGSTKFEVIDSHDGLGANAIGAIVEDESGQIWVSTTVGISRIDRDRHIVNFGQRDGAQGLGYWINSVARMPDGRIVFGGLGGATMFDPRRVVPPPLPEPSVTGLLLQNVPTPLRWRKPDSPLATSLWRGHQVMLTHDQNNVTFEFGAQAFADPESVEYAYRLVGHDAQWISAPSNRRLATYTDLRPGRYTLQVRARNDGAGWSDPPASVQVQVEPSPWASPRAYVLYGLGLLALAAMVAWQIQANLRGRRAVQESIRLSEERLKLALWGSGSELWDIDLATGQMHRDNQLEQLAASHEAVEQTLAAYRPFVHPDDIGRFENALGAHISGRTPAFEASYRTKNTDHDWVWILTRGRVVQRDDKGRALRLSGTTSDINALNQALGALRTLNEQLESRVEQRTAALQNANVELRYTLERLTLAQRQLFEAEKLASLGGLVAGIAHEINTPLGIGVTAASHLQEEAARMSRLVASGQLRNEDLEEFQQTARESSDMILRNLQRADRLVKSFKQVAVDQSSEDRRVVDLGVCINEILTTLGPSIKKTPHRVELECPIGLIVETAPGALYQIITNLVMNSLTHGFEGGLPGGIRIDVTLQDRVVQIDYRDNGRGMEDTVRARIFEPFFTTRRGQGGSGLGMHIVYSLVSQVLHGTIDCESALGEGTRFVIRFSGEVVKRRA